MHITPEVQNLVGALLAGDLNTWEGGYFTHLMSRSMAEQARDYPVLRYDYPERHKLYRFVNDTVLKGRPIDYLEFGVYQGDSLRQWLAINPDPRSRFFGFDSFEGLPEDWLSGDKQKGAFTCGGSVPDLGDPRAAIVKGWFNQTLEPFLADFKVKNQLVVHMDADLFSSTLYVLMTLNRIVAKGAVFVFDDFNPRDDFAAFHNYLRACGRKWRILAARQGFGKLAAMVF